ncbi:MAG TPA: cytochrome c oxidase assembly protein [Ktedonobacterales bacterium]|nr:cytochrome c oxidase assembly protein [Ktedonobacterales bacterium]
MHSSPAPTDWSFDPAVLLALAALLGGYLFIIGPLRERVAPDEPAQRRRIIAFAAGWLTLALALVSPLDALGRAYLFSAHTLQLFLLITVVAPLFLIGLPEWLWWTLLPTRALRDATRGVLFPTVAVIAFNGIILIWHVAPLYEAALHRAPLHDLQNASFLLAGLLTWWPLLTPLDRHTRLASPFQILYLVVESLPLDVFGAFTLFAQRVFYPTYALAPRLFGLSPLADQAIGGAILAVPGNLLDIVLMSLAFFGWIAREEQAQAARERLLYDTPQDALGLPAEVKPPGS